MEKTLKTLLEGLLNTLDPSKEVITESIREDISSGFVTAVTEAVEAEKIKIDESIAIQMEDLNKQIDTLKESHKAEKQELIDEGVKAVKTLDESFAEILEFTVKQFDEKAVEKLTQCKEAFDKALDVEIEDLCESVEAIIENKLEEISPEADLVDSAKLAKYEKAFESMKEIFFNDAILDQKVTESVGSMKADYDKLLSQNIAMAKKLNKIEVDAFIESETDGMKLSQKKYLTERFENSKISEIKESWESAKEDFKRIDEENRRLAKKTAEHININTKIYEKVKDGVNNDENLNETEAYYRNIAAQYSKLI